MTTLPERNLDQLRAIAVLSVLVNHALIAFRVTGGAWDTLGGWLGQAGVCAFFVHTSLVLMASLERGGDGPGWPLRFYVRRAFRIYPLAWAAIALVLLVRIPGWGHPFVAPTATALAANLALAQDLVGVDPVLGPLWTLPLELQMYVALPLCYLVARRASWRPLAALGAVGLTAAAIFAWGTSPAHYVKGLWRLDVLQFVPCFLAGVTAYWLLRRHRAARVPSWAWPWLVLAAIAASLPLYAAGHLFWLRIGYCAVIGAMIPVVRDGAESWWTRATHEVATYSYGVYLLHVPALWFARQLPLPAVAQFVAFVGMLVAAVWVAYHLIERPGITMGQRLAARIGQIGTPRAVSDLVPRSHPL